MAVYFERMMCMQYLQAYIPKLSPLFIGGDLEGEGHPFNQGLAHDAWQSPRHIVILPFMTCC